MGWAERQWHSFVQFKHPKGFDVKYEEDNGQINRACLYMYPRGISPFTGQGPRLWSYEHGSLVIPTMHRTMQYTIHDGWLRMSMYRIF